MGGNKALEHFRPDIIVFDEKDRICHLINVACQSGTRIVQKEAKKIDHYNELKYEI